MNKLGIIFCISLIFSATSFAQQQPSDGAFSKGAPVITPSAGFGNLYWGTGYLSNIPVNPTITYDYALTNKLGIGNIGLGLLLGYGSTQYFNFSRNTYSYSGILVGARGSYHIKLRTNKLDPYAGVMLGYIFTSGSKNNGNGDQASALPTASGKPGGMVPGAFAGIHYYLTQVFGLTGELGYNGFSVVNLGIGFRF
jgi:hypothetical protein